MLLDEVWRRVLEALVPAPRLPVGEWLDAHRVVTRQYPSPFPGPWRTSRTPYLREPLDAFNDPKVETLVLLLSSQIGKTEALIGALLYSYGTDPGPGIMVMPNLEMADSFSTDRLTPALKNCAGLRVGSRSRNADDAKRSKKINGAPLTLAGANSPASLSSRPVRDAFCDEIDRWPATTAEGDPLSLVIQRTAAYRRRKVVLTSTPTIKNASRIEDQYELSDQREYHLPCPRCAGFFVPKWRDVRWEDGDPSTAHLVCPLCSGQIQDHERKAMVAAGRWVARHPERKVRGYRTWAIVSPWTRLSEMVSGFLKAKRRPETLQSWVNLMLAESWEAEADKVESADLLSRREPYAEEVPRGAVVLTAGVDTQDDRLEALVVGWGEAEESWVVARVTCYGDPAQPGVWQELDAEVLNRAWRREAGGTTRVQCALVDALGHRTSSVYSAVAARQARRVYASIGRDGGESGQVASPPKVLRTSQGNVMRVIVDASQAKALVHARLKSPHQSGEGVVHFPSDFGEGYFDELTAEHVITERNKYNVPTKRWALRPGRTRNETLDCFGMALAALRVVCPSPARYSELAAKVTAAALQAPRDQTAAPPRQPRTRSWSG